MAVEAVWGEPVSGGIADLQGKDREFLSRWPSSSIGSSFMGENLADEAKEQAEEAKKREKREENKVEVVSVPGNPLLVFLLTCKKLESAKADERGVRSCPCVPTVPGPP